MQNDGGCSFVIRGFENQQAIVVAQGPVDFLYLRTKFLRLGLEYRRSLGRVVNVLDALLGKLDSGDEPGDLPYKGDTLIGNDVWLGYEALVMPGVKIGDGAIVAARAVVTRDVPPYSVVGGNPAQVVKRRYSDDVIAELLVICWWDWPVEKITRNLHAIVGADLSALRNAA